MTHLDAASYADLCAGRLPEAVAQPLREHLDTGCEHCESFLASASERGEVDGLDGLVDETLLELSPALEAASLDELGYARVQRELRMRRARPWLAGLGGLVAAAAVLLLVMPSEAPSWRTKGSGTPAVGAQLQLLAVVEGKPQPLVRGQQLPFGATLVFRVRLAEPGCVQLWRQGEGALHDTPRCLPGGDHVLADGDQPLGYLADAPGELRFELRLADREGEPAGPLGGNEASFTVEIGHPGEGALP